MTNLLMFLFDDRTPLIPATLKTTQNTSIGVATTNEPDFLSILVEFLEKNFTRPLLKLLLWFASRRFRWSLNRPLYFVYFNYQSQNETNFIEIYDAEKGIYGDE